MMKKLLFLTLLASASLFASAQFAYLKVSETLPDYGGEQPEQNAYNWFVTNYGSGNVLNMNQIPADASTYKVIWVNVERNISETDFDNLFPATALTALTKYVKAGGNLLLTKKASRLACRIGRMGDRGGSTYYPSWDNSGYAVGNDVWTINAMIGADYTLRDARQHPIFKDMATSSQYAHESFPLIGMVNRSNDNTIWTEMETKAGGETPNNNVATLNNFQSDWNCQVLAVWGHVRDYCGPVIVEFFPQNEYKGTVLSIGSNAYQWGTSNDYISNVQKLTQNALTYLSYTGVEYGYYMPYSLSEVYSIDEYQPEYNSAKWFYDNYVVTGKGRFIHKDEVFPDGMKVLWVHHDRVGVNSADCYNILGGDTFRDKLSNFVKAGGNVFLSKQATRLVKDINRATWYPRYGDGGYGDGNDIWYMTSNFVACGNTDRHNHPIFTYMQDYTENGSEGYCKWPLLNAASMPYRRTDNNCLWDDWSAYNISAVPTDVARLNAFESTQNCQILGGFGHTTALDAAGLIEFLPDATYAGKVIAMGLAAYQWTTVNNSSNMQNLTKGILTYLATPETYERDVRSGYFGTICLPKASTSFTGAEMFELDTKTADGNGIELTQVDALEAGKPYIFLANASKLVVTLTGAAVADAIPNKGLIGNLDNSDISVPKDKLILKDNQLYIVDTENVKVAKNRAYIDPSEVPAYPTTPKTSARRALRIHNTPTDVEALENTPAADRKIIRNGTLYIIHDGKTYNAQGQCIE